MSKNKRYYWLKLKEDFFEDDTIQWLEEQENGKDYVIFYLKLALKSLDDDGRLVRYVGETLIPYDVKALAKMTNTQPDTVSVAMKTFIEIGLVSRLNSGEIYMNQINEMIGTETDVARRVRQHRARKAIEEPKKYETLQCNGEVTKSNTEIEKDIDIYKGYIYTLFSFWNDQGIIKHRKMNQAMKSHINARLKEYSVEELKKAIKNYADVLSSDNYYWTHKWTLQDFMKPDNVVRF